MIGGGEGNIWDMPSIQSPPQDDHDDSVPRVTLRDIAESIGVSHVTVSYALRGMPRVSKALRDRICKEADRMGYRPDPMLSALSIYRQHKKATPVKAGLLWLMYWDAPEKFHLLKEFHAYWQGVQHVAVKQGFSLEQMSPTGGLTVGRINRIALSRGIKGVLLPPPQSTSVVDVDQLDWGAFSAVKFGYSFPSLPINLVTSAQAHNARLAMRKIRERGYRRIGFVTSSYSNERMRLLDGVLRVQADMPEEERVPFVCLPEEDVSVENPGSLMDWYAREKPDAILTNLREVAAMLKRARVRVPGDIALAALSVHDGNADAGIDQHPFEIGRAACEMLISSIFHNHAGLEEHPRQLLIEGSWVDGSMLPDRRRP